MSSYDRRHKAAIRRGLENGTLIKHNGVIVKAPRKKKRDRTPMWKVLLGLREQRIGRVKKGQPIVCPDCKGKPGFFGCRRCRNSGMI